MKKLITLSLIYLFLSLHAYSATQDQEVFEATMSLTKARYSFEDVEQVVLQLAKQGGAATHMTVEFKKGEQQEYYDLSVTDAQPDENGCMTYYASLESENPDVLFGKRFSVNLVDYSTCNHSDNQAGLWRAWVRSGFGWCGTMDATMELSGNPERI